MLSRFRVPLSWRTLLRRTAKEAVADDVLNLAAQQAYYFFFALFPALLALLSIASFFPVHNLVDEVVAMLGRVAPPDVIKIVTEQLGKISNTNAGGLLTFAFLFTLWSTSNAVVSMCSTLNAAYDIIETRPWWKVRAIAIGLTLGLAFFILVSMTLIVAGPTLAERIAESMRLGPVFEWTWKLLQWPLIFALVSTGIAMVYYFAPDAEQDWTWITPGSILATALWIVISLGFKFYLSRFGSYEAYGAIGGVMVLMLWFYLSGLAILIGAELNAEIEHASPYGKNPGEKVPGQRKKIGVAAERDYQERKASGELEVELVPDGINCDIDRPPAQEPSEGIKPSALLIGTAALLPAAVKIGLDLKRKLTSRSATSDDRAA
jgi:membrane protein